jgi:hypothetical protein
MNKLLQIVNYKNCHYEIIETIIVKYHIILNIDKNTPINIYLDILDNKCFKQYLSNKYPKIQFKYIQNYDYYINCTVYDADFNILDYNKNSVKKYIAHEITCRLIANPNIFYLTPLSKTNYIYADILPYTNNKKTSDIPIYIIQGNLNQQRRYLNLLKIILHNSYRYKFIIKLIGKGHLPNELKQYKDKIIVKKNLNFIDFHKEFLDAYCILPLISIKTHPHYYQNKLTSTINYARGYNLKCLIDKDLQKIYNLKNVEIYNNINDITSSFTKTLEQFYNKT